MSTKRLEKYLVTGELDMEDMGEGINASYLDWKMIDPLLEILDLRDPVHRGGLARLLVHAQVEAWGAITPMKRTLAALMSLVADAEEMEENPFYPGHEPDDDGHICACRRCGCTMEVVNPQHEDERCPMCEEACLP